MDTETPSPLQRCVRVLGSKSAVARVVGIKPQSAIEIINKDGRTPAEWCIPLERATAEAGEVVSRHELRPDIYPRDEPAPDETQPTEAAA